MAGVQRKTISLPPDLAREAELRAKAEHKTLSAVVQDSLRATRAARLKGELRVLQGYWQHKAIERGVLTQRDLDRYLNQ